MKIKIIFVTIFVLCFTSLAFAESFHGTYTWYTYQNNQQGTLLGQIQVAGSVNFRLNNFGPSGTYYGVMGSTTDGRLSFSSDWSEPGSATFVNENYSTALSVFFQIGHICEGDIPTMLSMNELYGNLQQGFPPTMTADLILYIDPCPVPEPSTMLLLGIGLAGAAVARRKFAK